MNRVLAAGVVLALAGATGYLFGLATPYPGRAFSVTAIMIGITLIAVRRSGASEVTEG